MGVIIVVIVVLVLSLTGAKLRFGAITVSSDAVTLQCVQFVGGGYLFYREMRGDGCAKQIYLYFFRLGNLRFFIFSGGDFFGMWVGFFPVFNFFAYLRMIMKSI